MKLLLLCAAIVLPFRKNTPLTPELYKRLQTLCRAAAGGDSGSQRQRYEELYEAVMQKLLADDCRLLREVKSVEPTNSWLRSVIRTTSIDLFRKSMGRPIWRRLGNHSQAICKLALTYGYPAEEVQRLLREYPPNVEISVEEIDRVVLEIQRLGRIKFDPDGTSEVMELHNEETNMMEIDFIDDGPTPDDILADHERMQTLKLFLLRLAGEDKLLISLFFGLDGDRMTLNEIAELLKSTEAALQKRKDRLIIDFREWLHKQQVSLEELICRQITRSAS